MNNPTEAELDRELDILLDGDDGSVGEDRERQLHAVETWNRRTTVETWDLIKEHHRRIRPTDSCGIMSILFPWNNRQGQPWQSDIEAHVAAYRHPATDREIIPLIEECRGRGVYIYLAPRPEDWVVEARMGDEWWNPGQQACFVTCQHDNLKYTVKLAAVMAMMGMSTPNTTSPV